jgi:Tfp pilus assembly protein FimV
MSEQVFSAGVQSDRPPLSAGGPLPITAGRGGTPAARGEWSHSRRPAGTVRPTLRARLLGVLLVVAVVLLLLPGLARGSGPGRDPARTAAYVVQPGDTLWAIAGRVAPSRDPREVVHQIVRDNHLDGSLQAGTELQVPVVER